MNMDQYLVYARLLLRQGRGLEVEPWLGRLERFARERGLIRWLITIHILQALAVGNGGERRAAGEYLARAVQLAAPEGYFRAFLDEDRRVLALLRLPEVRQAAPEFVDQLLAYAAPAETPDPAQDTPSVRPAAQALIEPLSERELEVLSLIAAGLSNREIAGRLFIAVGTVKRHINNIYGKMQVHRRTEAVARARDLGLL
jgi:LuxR family maltose regulon positive regulatory protein